MEEKLRNLSQNIENNTGVNAHKPEETPPPEEHHEEEPHEEEHHDEEPREEEHREEEHHEESHEESHDEPPMDEAEENVPEPEAEPEPEPEEKPEPENSEKAKILTMDEAEEPHESPTRTKKYSPEVEAALDRLNSDDASVNFNSEPLSTEPKKQHHFGRVLVSLLLILAIAATVVCVLVEQKVIDNPLNWFDKKSSSSTEPTSPEPPAQKTTTEPVALTDQTLISAIDTIFAKHVATDNYYVFSRTSQTLSGKDYIYYDVAETPAVDCADGVTDCVVEKVTADNYKNYSAYRYTFVATDFEVYEFESRAVLSEAEVLNNVTTNLDQPTTPEKE